MSTAIPETANRRLVAAHEQKRLQRLVAASREPKASILAIDEVLLAHFHASHIYAVALVRYLDDTCGLVFAAYHGEVRVTALEVSGVVHRALQLSPPKVGLRIDHGVVHVQATDVYGKPQTCELSLPGH